MGSRESKLSFLNCPTIFCLTCYLQLRTFCSARVQNTKRFGESHHAGSRIICKCFKPLSVVSCISLLLIRILPFLPLRNHILAPSAALQRVYVHADSDFRAAACHDRHWRDGATPSHTHPLPPSLIFPSLLFSSERRIQRVRSITTLEITRMRRWWG